MCRTKQDRPIALEEYKSAASELVAIRKDVNSPRTYPVSWVLGLTTRGPTK